MTKIKGAKPRRKTLSEFREAQKARERNFVVAALRRNKWLASATCRELGITDLRALLNRLDLTELYKEHSPGSGRPPTKAKKA